MKVGLGLGSNLGDRLLHLQQAKRFLLSLCALLALSCAHLGSRELPSACPYAADIRARLDQRIFENVNFLNANITDVIQYIAEVSRDSSGRTDVCITIRVPYVSAELDPPQSPERHTSAEFVSRPRATITLTMRSATFREVLNEVCRQADLVWQIESGSTLATPPGCVLITPRSEKRRVR